MERIIIIALGGVATATLENVTRHIKERNRQKPYPNTYTAISLDNDPADLEWLQGSATILFPDNEKLAIKLPKLSQFARNHLFGEEPDCKQLKNYAKTDRRSRRLASTSFFLGMTDPDIARRLQICLEQQISLSKPGDKFTCYFVASVEGSFGSAVMIPLAYYVKRFFKDRHLSVRRYGLFLQPFSKNVLGFLLNGSERQRLHANAYATMLELNALNLLAAGQNKKAEEDKTLRKILFRLGHTGLEGTRLLFTTDGEDHPFHTPFNKMVFIDRGIYPDTFDEYRTEVGTILENALENHLTYGTVSLPAHDKSVMEVFNDYKPMGRCYLAYHSLYPTVAKDHLLSFHIVTDYRTFPYLNPKKEDLYRTTATTAMLYTILEGKTGVLVRAGGLSLCDITKGEPNVWLPIRTSICLSTLFYDPPTVEAYAKEMDERYQKEIGTIPELSAKVTAEEYAEVIHKLPLVQDFFYHMTTTKRKDKTCNIATLGYFETFSRFGGFRTFPTDRLFLCAYHMIKLMVKAKLPKHLEDKVPYIMACLLSHLSDFVTADKTLTDEEKNKITDFLKKHFLT